MAIVTEDFLLQLLHACAAGAPVPLYPARFAKDQSLDRDKLDAGLEELRRRGLVKLTDWEKDLGQGYALTDAGNQALRARRVPTGRATAAPVEGPGELTHYGRGEIVRNSVFDPSPPFVSRLLLIANLMFFGYGAYLASSGKDLDINDYLAGTSETTEVVLRDLGALYPGWVFPPAQRPQFERIILSSFLHIGVLHLIMNMYFLFSMGQIIESMWGAWRFLTIYFIAGIVSGCVVLMFSIPQTRSGLTAGASGCLFGIFMALLVWFWLNRQYLPDGLIQDWSRNLATNAFLLIAINFLPNVSWQGHLGGAIGGLLASLLFHVQRFHPSSTVRMLALAGLPLIPLGFFLAMLWEARAFGLFR